jgi:hypothetical protein
VVLLSLWLGNPYHKGADDVDEVQVQVCCLLIVDYIQVNHNKSKQAITYVARDW